MKSPNETEVQAERVVQLRNDILRALPDEPCSTQEVVLAGLTLFLQAALYATDGDQETVERLTKDCIELAMQMNDHEKAPIH